MQIKYLCQKESSVEWSGVLFYSTEGEFGTPTFKCVAEELLLMDIGTGAYTEYDYDEKFVKLLMKNPHLMKLKRGHIHSHNNMGVFFSGTDNNELIENSEHYDYYLSLIVNNSNQMCAKIAFRARIVNEGTKRYYYTSPLGETEGTKEEYKNEELALLTFDCAISGQHPVIGVSDEFIARYEEIKKEKGASFSSRGVHYGAPDYGKYSSYRSYTPDQKEKKLDSSTTQGSFSYNWGDDDDSSPNSSLLDSSLGSKNHTEGPNEEEEEEEVYYYEEEELEKIEDFIVETLKPGTSEINDINAALVEVNELRRDSIGQSWKWKLSDMKNQRFAAYKKIYPEDRQYEKYDAILKDAHICLSGEKLVGPNASNSTHNTLIDELISSVFVK